MVDITSIFISIIIAIVVVNLIRRLSYQSKKTSNVKSEETDSDTLPTLKIIYGTQTGTAKRMAEHLSKASEERGIKVTQFLRFSLIQ